MVGEFDPASLERLGRGEVLVSTEPVSGWKTPRLLMSAVVDAPLSAVWAVMSETREFARFMPRVKRAEDLSRDGARRRVRTVVHMPFPVPNLTAITRVTHTEEPGVRCVREWTLESGDYRINDGSWTLLPFDGDAERTLALYRIHIEPKMPIPKSIQAAIQERAMPGLVDAIRAEVRRRQSVAAP